MPPRAHLSEEAEKEEYEDRERSRLLRTKLRDLIDRRRRLIDEVRRISDEQHELYERRRPGQEEVERIHEEYRELGHRIVEARRVRDAARQKVLQAIGDLREFRARLPRGEKVRPEAIRREIADLERRQQTTALPIAEENALIDRLRKLTQSLVLAEQAKGVADEQIKALAALEAALTERRAEMAKRSEELPKLIEERERRMQAIKGRLAAAGQLVGEIRGRAKAREALMEKIRLLGTDIEALEKEFDKLERASRDRRREANAVISEYRRSVGGGVDGETARSRAADERLEQLLKRGKVELRG